MTADMIWSYDQTNLFNDDKLQLDEASYSNNHRALGLQQRCYPCALVQYSGTEVNIISSPQGAVR